MIGQTVALLLVALFAFGAGFAARQAFVPEAPLSPQLDLSDGAVARMVHEAYRAYSNSVGKIGVRGWASLQDETKKSLMQAVAYVRKGGKVISKDATDVRVALIHAIVGIVAAR